MSESIRGVVFDVDGVLFDTERLTFRTWTEVGAQMGWPQTGERYLEFVGQGAEFMAACSERSQQRMEREGVPLKPGVREILDFLRLQGIPAALATSTGRVRTLRRLELTGLGEYFQTVVTGDQVEHSKPDPEIYLLACRALDTPPGQTLAVEDSRNGILSAHAAGMPVVMVPDMIPPAPELEALLWRRCASLSELRDVLLSRSRQL